MIAAKCLATPAIVAVLVVFPTLEWALDYCAACWVCGLWYRAGVGGKG
jgi:hypothetical protein